MGTVLEATAEDNLSVADLISQSRLKRCLIDVSR